MHVRSEAEHEPMYKFGCHRASVTISRVRV